VENITAVKEITVAGETNFDVVQANQFLGPGLLEISPFAKLYYVDGTNGSDGYTGTKPSRAFLTIAKAITMTVAARGDTVIIAPGTYTEAVLNPKSYTIFRAGLFSARRPSVIITSNIADMVTVDVDGVQFHGIEFLAAGNTTDNLINVGSVAAVDGCLINGCVFNGADKTTVVGIKIAHATIASLRLVVVNSLFRDLTGTHISVGVMGFAYSYIGFNQFAIDVNSGTAINLADTTTFAIGKGYVIEHNTFTGFDATADEVGITIAGTANTTGAGIIRNNYFAYLASGAGAITVDKLELSLVNNYIGHTTTGGSLVTS
jgi:hypothetical protein